MHKYRLLIMLLLGVAPLIAQEFLYVKQQGGTPAHRFSVYDQVEILTQNSEQWHEGIITAIHREHVELNGLMYHFADIMAMRRHNTFFQVAGTGLSMTGLLYPLIAGGNQLTNFRRPLLTRRDILFSTSAFGSGLLLRFLARRTYRRSKGYFWETIDFQDLSNE